MWAALKNYVKLKDKVDKLQKLLLKNRRRKTHMKTFVLELDQGTGAFQKDAQILLA